MNRPTPQRSDLLSEIAHGEDSTRQFKADVRNAESLASEMAAFVPVGTLRKRRESVGKTSGKIFEACRERSSITIPELAALIGITERSIERNIQKLQATGLLRRVGGRKEGHWEIIE